MSVSPSMPPLVLINKQREGRVSPLAILGFLRSAHGLKTQTDVSGFLSSLNHRRVFSFA